MANDEIRFGVTTKRSLAVRSLVAAREVVMRHGSEERRERIELYFSGSEATSTPEDIMGLQSEVIAGLAEIIDTRLTPRPRGRPRKDSPRDEPAQV